MRSWPPLSCGFPGRERISRMPSDTSQAESCVSPPRALVQTKGEPLSHWIARGVPCSWKSCSRTSRTSAPRAPGKSVADCKRLALLPVASPPPAFEVHGPQIVSSGNLDAGPTVNTPDAHRRPAPLHFAEPAQDAHDRAAARSVRSKTALQHPRDLVRAPARMLIAQRENRENDVLTGTARARVGPPALLDQAQRSELPVPSQPLVPGLPRDAELLAKRREIAAFLRRSLHELKFQTHGALLFPGHPSFEYRQRCPDTFCVIYGFGQHR